MPKSAGDDATNLVAQYIKDISDIDLLTTQQERQLGRAISEGLQATGKLENSNGNLAPKERARLRRRVEQGKRAKDELVGGNYRLVISIAQKYREYGVPFMDLIQEGNLGLIRATEKFDYRRGCKFSTYATWWIRQSITRAVAQRHTIRLPVYKGEQVNRYNRAVAALSQKLGRSPTIGEIAREMQLPLSTVNQIRECLTRQPVSLDYIVDDGNRKNGRTRYNFVADGDSVLEQVELSALFRHLEEALNLLSPREAAILRLRFGLGGREAHTLDEVGKKFGLTRERIRQVEQEALRKLRHPRLLRRLI